MRNCREIYRVASIALTAVALATLMACSTAPRIKPQPLAHWSGPEDCGTEYASAVSGLPPERGAAPSLLVDSIGGVWNCVTIPGGRYDAEVVVRWSNGRRETALEARGIEVAAGQRLIVKAFERNRGAIDASFSEVRVQLEPDPAWGAKAAQAPEVDKSIPAAPPDSERAEAKAPLGADSTSAAPAVAPPDQSPSPGIGASREGPHPVIQAAKVAGLVVLALALANLSNGESLVRLPDAIGNVLRRPGLGSDDEVYGTRYNVNRARYSGPSGPPSADCCFVWIEDGVTGVVIAGNRPVRN